MSGEYPIQPASGDLFDRVVSILEQTRADVVRAVNNSMVIAYWLIGREIVQELQAGSVLKDNKQLFASKYMLYLPTE